MRINLSKDEANLLNKLIDDSVLHDIHMKGALSMLNISDEELSDRQNEISSRINILYNIKKKLHYVIFPFSLS